MSQKNRGGVDQWNTMDVLPNHQNFSFEQSPVCVTLALM